MKCLLPIEKNPPVKMLPGYAQPLSIIYARIKNPDVFLINNFTQLFVDDYAGVNTLEFKNFSTRHVVGFYLDECAFTDIFNIESISVEKYNSEIVLNMIKQKIDDDKYVFSILNEFYIPKSYFYKKLNMFHSELLYGYDDDLKELYGFVYDKNPKYTAITIRYEDFKEAYNNTDETVKYLTIYSLKENINFKYNFKLNKKLLFNYINSQSNNMNSYKSHSMFGISIYDFILDELNKYPKQRIDPRNFAALYEHKTIMLKRIKEYFNLPELAKEYEQVVMLAIGARTRAYQCFINKYDENIRQEIISSIKKMRKMEHNILLRVYDSISNIRENSNEAFDERQVNSNRPYTLTSTVKDFANDKEVWEILNEYLPNVSDVSQLSLVYGMKIEKVILLTKKYFKLSDNEINEILVRIFSL